MIILAFIACFVVGLIAWVLIPSKPHTAPPNGPNGGPPSVGPLGVPSPAPILPGPNQLSIEEKMAVVELELRRKQADKFRAETIAEIRDLISSDSGTAAGTSKK